MLAGSQNFMMLHIELCGEEEKEVVLAVRVVIVGGRGRKAVNHSAAPSHGTPYDDPVDAGTYFGDAFVRDGSSCVFTHDTPGNVAEEERGGGGAEGEEWAVEAERGQLGGEFEVDEGEEVGGELVGACR